MRYFHYSDLIGVIRIKASRRPSESTKPRSGTWIVRELNKGEWEVPSFPEITWGILKDFEYLGSTPLNPSP